MKNSSKQYSREAMFWEKKEDGVRCLLCPHYCFLKNNTYGKCGVRQNQDGVLMSINYGCISSMAIDPIEKKPLHFYHQGTKIFSIGSVGCNFKCSFCQNCDISLEFDTSFNDYKKMTPEELVELARHYDLDSIAYTYNEPTVFYEMVYDTAILSKKAGMRNVLVTNGFINAEPFKTLAPFIDAMNIDVKTYDDVLYQSVCGGRLKTILETIKLALEYKIHIELTCLIVPSLFKDINEVEVFLKELYKVSGDVPLHISRYFPRYHCDEEATDILYMLEIKKRAVNYFSHVILGNI